MEAVTSAEIVAVPLLTAVTLPVWSTVAILPLEVFQVIAEPLEAVAAKVLLSPEVIFTASVTSAPSRVIVTFSVVSAVTVTLHSACALPIDAVIFAVPSFFAVTIHILPIVLNSATSLLSISHVSSSVEPATVATIFALPPSATVISVWDRVIFTFDPHAVKVNAISAQTNTRSKLVNDKILVFFIIFLLF